MDGLTGRAPNSANGERLWRFLGTAVITSRHTLLDNLDLAIEARRATFNQGHISSQAHFIHVSSRVEIVEGVEGDAKSPKPRNGELGILDVRMVRNNVDAGVELLRSLFGNLTPVNVGGLNVIFSTTDVPKLWTSLCARVGRETGG